MCMNRHEAPTLQFVYLVEDECPVVAEPIDELRVLDGLLCSLKELRELEYGLYP